MFFCTQADLLPEEYEDNSDTIFFKVKNTTLYDFRRVNAVVENKTSILEEFVSKVTRICLSEFGAMSNHGKTYTFKQLTYFFHILFYYLTADNVMLNIYL
jgi:hypothetical protein